MTAFLGRSAFVMPNGVEGIPAVRRTFETRRVFGTAARIAPQKRLEDLIEVFSGIPAPLLIPASTLRVMAKASLHHLRYFSMDKMLERYRALVPPQATRFSPCSVCKLKSKPPR